jgi:putative tryptophan/tyrosine transport system substrate-binding protein
MRRREFVALVGGAVAAWPLATQTQQTSRAWWRIAQVIAGSPESNGHLAEALEKQLGDLGYRPNENLTLVTHFVTPQPKAIEDVMRSLISESDLLVVWGTITAVAAKNMVHDKPIIFLTVGAPVEIGLVESLARPGGNLTGITFEAATETYGKRLQLLKELAPGVTRVAVLGARGDPNVGFATDSLSKAAQALGLTMMPVDFDAGDDLDAKFDEMKKIGAEGLIVVAGALTYERRQQIADLALSRRLPSCHGFHESVAAGGLASLGPDMVAMAGQAASYIDKIVHGAKPADLPVQQPSRYLLHLNLRTAKALGLNIRATVLASADEVIE